jgi:hypothetical protein
MPLRGAVGKTKKVTFEKLDVGVALVSAARARLGTEKGFSPELRFGNSTDHETFPALLEAASCIIRPALNRDGSHNLKPNGSPFGWPFRKEDWDAITGDKVKNLAIAGALIAAEIDRLIAAGDVTHGSQDSSSA